VRLPLASAPTGSIHRIGFVGHYMGTVNVGSHVSGVPLFYMTLREKGHCHSNGRRHPPPDQNADEDLSIYEISHS
jgi:hypothetical protein